MMIFFHYWIYLQTYYELTTTDIILLKYLFIYLLFFLLLCQVFVAVHQLSLVAVSRGYSLLWCTSFSLQWLFSTQSTGSRHMDYSTCALKQLQHMSSKALIQQLWCIGLVVLWHEGSSRIRDQIDVSSIGRWILNLWITRVVLVEIFTVIYMNYFSYIKKQIPTSGGGLHYNMQRKNPIFSIKICRVMLRKILPQGFHNF